MKVPDRPTDEVERLLRLRSYSILDTDPEAVFDDLARIAAHALSAPIGLVSLVDADRQWFKARYGLEAAETSRDISFCGHVVAATVPIVVNDARDDERFVDNPLVTGPLGIRFYAGAPLRTADGFTLGTLCAIDHEPRQPTEAQLEILGCLANLVVEQLEARRGRFELATERAEAKRLSERQAIVFESMAEGVVVQDATGMITLANKAAERILGLTRDQMSGRTSLDPSWRSVHENGEPFPGQDHPAMVSLRTGRNVQNVTMGIHKPTGELTWISINSVPRHVDDQVEETVTTFHEITALKLAAARAHQHERLATVGTLAAGVGHEINNPLAFVVGNIDFAIEEVEALAGPSPSHRMCELAQALSEVREGADRIRQIVKGLRALAREDVALLGVDVRNAIESSLSMCAHEIRHRATVDLEIAEVPLALADEARLAQVLVNLLMNACQAFEHQDPDRNRIVVSVRHSGDRIQIAVSDNGPGVPQELQTHIFDPFFTTKPAGSGTGLGLAVSRSIMIALGGELTFDAERKVGAEFRLRLPVAAAAPEAEATTAVSSGPFGRIMVVDDEPVVASAIRRILKRAHHVTTFSDPRDALEKIRSGEQFDLILCDLAMPYLNGPELFRRAIALRPELERTFVFITGGVTQPDIRGFLDGCSNERLNKPFASADLLAIARRYACTAPR